MRIIPGLHIDIHLDEGDHFIGEFPDEVRWTACIEESANVLRTLKFQLSNGAHVSVNRDYTQIVNVFDAKGRMFITEWLDSGHCTVEQDVSRLLPGMSDRRKVLGTYPNVANQIKHDLNAWGKPHK